MCLHKDGDQSVTLIIFLNLWIFPWQHCYEVRTYLFSFGNCEDWGNAAYLNFAKSVRAVHLEDMDEFLPSWQLFSDPLPTFKSLMLTHFLKHTLEIASFPF